MSLYRVTDEKLDAVPQTSFAAENLLERKDLQRLLRRNIGPLGEDLMVIAEEFGEWEDCNRRIDLLCLTKDGALAVVEIKRTDDGGHMELQAIRYAAMVSSMTLEQAIAAYGRTASKEPDAARNEVLEFLQVESADEAELSGDVRIILVSADFSTELTTAVLWLNKYELDITCIRLKPYRVGSEVFVDVTQIIPLPEAADYEVKVRAQEKEKRKVVGARQEILRKFWTQFVERSKSRTDLLANRSPTKDHWISAGIGRTGFSLHVSLARDSSRVECYISLPGPKEKSKAAFAALFAKRDAIEQSFGSTINWQDLPDRDGCRVSVSLAGGWQTPEADWPKMQASLLDVLIRFEAALRKPIQDLKL